MEGKVPVLAASACPEGLMGLGQDCASAVEDPNVETIVSELERESLLVEEPRAAVVQEAMLQQHRLLGPSLVALRGQAGDAVGCQEVAIVGREGMLFELVPGAFDVLSVGHVKQGQLLSWE